MSGNKYDKYFVENPTLTRGGFFPVVVANGAEVFEGAEYSLRIHYIAEDGPLVREPHSHDFEQVFFFLNADFSKVTEFDAEVVLCLGEEVEEHVITVPTAVHVPIGMIHGPLSFRNVKKPIVFLDTLLSAQYSVK